MAAKLTRLTHKMAIQLHLVAESCTISSSGSRRPVRKLLDTASYSGSSHLFWNNAGDTFLNQANIVTLSPVQASQHLSSFRRYTTLHLMQYC